MHKTRESAGDRPEGESALPEAGRTDGIHNVRSRRPCTRVTQPSIRKRRHCARVGKIALLPAKVRDELNFRLYDGHSGRKILLWLNSLPEVKQRIQENFPVGRQEITNHNLSEWRHGGYKDYLAALLRTEVSKDV